MIPHAPGGAATLNVFVCGAEHLDPVGGAACAGPAAHPFVGVVNQLIEVDVSAAIVESQRVIARSVLVVAALSGLLAFPVPLPGQTPDWFGTWRLNLDKSIYNPGPPPYRRATMTVERWEDNVRFSYDFVHLRGGVQHMEWTGLFDGKDYMVQGTDEYITYAYKRIDDRTYEIVAKLDTRITAVATVTLSPDGRTLTTVTRGKNARGQDVTNTTVYERID
jgi:hypothetical protein